MTESHQQSPDAWFALCIVVEGKEVLFYHTRETAEADTVALGIVIDFISCRKKSAMHSAIASKLVQKKGNIDKTLVQNTQPAVLQIQSV